MQGRFSWAGVLPGGNPLTVLTALVTCGYAPCSCLFLPVPVFLLLFVCTGGLRIVWMPSRGWVTGLWTRTRYACSNDATPVAGLGLARTSRCRCGAPRGCQCLPEFLYSCADVHDSDVDCLTCDVLLYICLACPVIVACPRVLVPLWIGNSRERRPRHGSSPRGTCCWNDAASVAGHGLACISLCC